MSGQRGALVAAALVALALVLPMAQQAVPAASRSSAPSAVRLPSPAERAAIVAALREDWTSAPYQELERMPWNSGPLPRHINYSSLHLAVSKVVVARSGPLLTEAAAAPVNARGVPVLPPGIVLLNSFARGASWEVLYGAMTVFPNACSGATPADFRELLCPSPWRVLGLRPPLLPHLVEERHQSWCKAEVVPRSAETAPVRTGSPRRNVVLVGTKLSVRGPRCPALCPGVLRSHHG